MNNNNNMKIKIIIKLLSIVALSQGLAIQLLGGVQCNHWYSELETVPNYCQNWNVIYDLYVIKYPTCNSSRCENTECITDQQLSQLDTTMHYLAEVVENCGGRIASSHSKTFLYHNTWNDPFSTCMVPDDCDQSGPGGD
ncbi:hypothetical protein GCM10007047_02700 [Cerasicoccus arenae]|uniref:Uncharacterized protein n=1 Tax=Cerasicoccus arenae TaxID=424488 RepID=A0A8J3D931_9BACT|nr:hypothetical protein GCM10007047_02700 [Cerasicoccus arenae]